MPVSDGLTTSTRATCGSMIRAISHASPVTSSATRSSGPRLATSQKSRCTSNATDLTTASFGSARQTGDAVGKRHRRIRAQSATGQVAQAATEKPGLKRPSSNNRPAQHAFSQKPLSRSRDPNRPDLEQQASERHFQAPNLSSGSIVAGPGDALLPFAREAALSAGGGSAAATDAAQVAILGMLRAR